MKFLTAEWRKLMMLNYEVDASLLQPYVPYGTELDAFQGKLQLSLVAFMFLDTRLLACPIPFHRNFEEMNLRFYVRYKHREEWRRGVVFIKEIVPKFMISFVANTVYGEHYETLPMQHIIKTTKDTLHVEYHVKKAGSWHKIIVDASNQLMKLKAGSELEFITEHYWGYTKLNETKTSQYEVGHPTWDIYPVNKYALDGDFSQVYGAKFEFLNKAPDSVYLAEGSDIFVRMGGLIT